MVTMRYHRGWNVVKNEHGWKGLRMASGFGISGVEPLDYNR
jgi:hypothetical protein